MASTRTDIHRPSAAEFDPEGYECYGVYDLMSGALDPGHNMQDRINTVSRLIKEGYHFTGVHGMGQCDHCGAGVRYTALMIHPDTKGMIWIGETCLDNRFSLTKGEFAQLRKQAAANRDKQVRAEKIAAIIDDMATDLRAAYDWAISEACNNHIATDIAGKVAQYASELSERQEEFLVNLHGRFLRFTEEQKEKFAKADTGEIATVPTGRVQITGTILGTKMVESDYGLTEKMLVEDDRGFKVYGTVPSSIYSSGDVKGMKVTFSAKVEPSNNDAFFGFFSRPTKAKVLEVPTAPAEA